MNQNNFDLLKSHIDAYTRKDGAVVTAHDDKRVAAKPISHDAVTSALSKHGDIMVRKGTEWDHKGIGGKKVPASDVAKFPEFSHEEVYGHDYETSPSGTDFSKEFAAKGHQGFVLKHGDGKRSVVNTEGSDYARYHAPVAESGGDDYGHPNVVGKPSKMVNGNWTKETGYKETEHTGKPTEAHAIHFAGKKYLSSGKTGTSMHDNTPTRAFNEDDGTDEGGSRVWLDDKARVHADSGSEVKGLRAKYEAHASKST